MKLTITYVGEPQVKITTDTTYAWVRHYPDGADLQSHAIQVVAQLAATVRAHPSLEILVIAPAAGQSPCSIHCDIRPLLDAILEHRATLTILSLNWPVVVPRSVPDGDWLRRCGQLNALVIASTLLPSGNLVASLPPQLSHLTIEAYGIEPLAPIRAFLEAAGIQPVPAATEVSEEPIANRIHASRTQGVLYSGPLRCLEVVVSESLLEEYRSQLYNPLLPIELKVAGGVGQFGWVEREARDGSDEEDVA